MGTKSLFKSRDQHGKSARPACCNRGVDRPGRRCASGSGRHAPSEASFGRAQPAFFHRKNVAELQLSRVSHCSRAGSRDAGRPQPALFSCQSSRIPRDATLVSLARASTQGATRLRSLTTFCFDHLCAPAIMTDLMDRVYYFRLQFCRRKANYTIIFKGSLQRANHVHSDRHRYVLSIYNLLVSHRSERSGLSALP